MNAAGPWIPMSERPPPELEPVLVRSITGTIAHAFYECDYGWTVVDVGPIDNVTHWAQVIPPVLCELCVDPIDKPHVDEYGSQRWRACQNLATRQVSDEKGRTLNVCEECFERGAS